MYVESHTHPTPLSEMMAFRTYFSKNLNVKQIHHSMEVRRKMNVALFNYIDKSFDNLLMVLLKQFTETTNVQHLFLIFDYDHQSVEYFTHQVLTKKLNMNLRYIYGFINKGKWTYCCYYDRTTIPCEYNIHKVHEITETHRLIEWDGFPDREDWTIEPL